MSLRCCFPAGISSFTITNRQQHKPTTFNIYTYLYILPCIKPLEYLLCSIRHQTFTISTLSPLTQTSLKISSSWIVRMNVIPSSTSHLGVAGPVYTEPHVSSPFPYHFLLLLLLVAPLVHTYRGRKSYNEKPLSVKIIKTLSWLRYKLYSFVYNAILNCARPVLSINIFPERLLSQTLQWKAPCPDILRRQVLPMSFS